MNLNEHVGNLLKKHTGGEEFFDALDNSFRDSNDLLGTLMERVMQNSTCCNIIVSGTFGHVISNYIQNNRTLSELFNVISVKGGLRKGEQIDSLEWVDAKGEHFTFIDDSFYLGRTRDVIEAELERCGMYLEETFVIYDGSKEADETVYSLYRYYDHH